MESNRVSQFQFDELNIDLQGDYFQTEVAALFCAYDEMKSTYGVRIEGTVPDEFTLAGTAKFSGYDTIPTGILSSNTGAAKVYYTSGTPDVILMETSWFTAPVGENSETQHRGFNVYILYDCPLSKN